MKTSNWFYAVGIAGLGIQQFIHTDFRPVILPPSWPHWLHAWNIWAFISGAALIITAIMLVIGKKRKTGALLLALFFLAMFVVFQVPYLLFVSPYSPRHLGLWTDPLKELALSGGALILASSFWKKRTSGLDPDAPLRNGLMTVGRIFFSVMLIAFGMDHLYYTKTVADLIPGWIPGHYFWTYFAAIALIGSGVCILLKIRIALVSLLAGLMLLLWIILLHIPRAIMFPTLAQGNEITSVFEALAFSGTAIMLYVEYSAWTPSENHKTGLGEKKPTPPPSS